GEVKTTMNSEVEILAGIWEDKQCFFVTGYKFGSMASFPPELVLSVCKEGPLWCKVL
ncbi:hypothetical protein Tco_0049095, partial [Tanacetum coccineum]